MNVYSSDSHWQFLLSSGAFHLVVVVDISKFLYKSNDGSAPLFNSQLLTFLLKLLFWKIEQKQLYTIDKTTPNGKFLN